MAILTAIDKKSVLLFVLILVVCALFVANSATAAVRGRRQELGVLACLGWTRPRLFAVVLGDEPTGNLDPQNGGEILGLLGRLRESRGRRSSSPRMTRRSPPGVTA